MTDKRPRMPAYHLPNTRSKIHDSGWAAIFFVVGMTLAVLLIVTCGGCASMPSVSFGPPPVKTAYTTEQITAGLKMEIERHDTSCEAALTAARERLEQLVKDGLIDPKYYVQCGPAEAVFVEYTPYAQLNWQRLLVRVWGEE